MVQGELVDGDDTDELQNECPAATYVTTPVGFSDWQMIGNAKSPVYMPDSATFNDDSADDTDEVAYCLRATATYMDDFGGNTEMAHGVSEAPVEISDPANTAPEFADDQDLNTPGKQADAERSVPENEDDFNVGEAVSARDDDGDLLIIKIDDTANFKVDNNGQIKTKVELDYETQSEYTVVLTAIDPSGAEATVTVMITVTDENDPATITGVETVEYAEDRTDVVATFSATDVDEDADDIEWSLEGVDEGIFEIDGGVLTFEDPPDFEDKKDKDEDLLSAGDQGARDNMYQVTVVASGAQQDVVVEVTDVDEPGKVTFTQPQPQVSRSLMAMGPGDPDAGVTGESWMWSSVVRKILGR